ncbi:MAG: hypothetical protein COU85_02305 [Candidatus Portnoybacteria bacterium CG10_big_fil_rev_8_21_14_0_10_44_7]|uniref:Rod shape-determining protein MreD n=1 Tax=Candidatus Portnoybacteria bacterium CG10_big_fil_rev_8_21_14_0_10_44_7 TaxID=1974816 RepID=A0A2M8KIF8_9BACT|nr:MAG: hypothetical protein COU85_02305 [Candidatus Portnoybacteria bacterium CG10_big_fil_rev_8_21_14_0_10_44_7]
MLKIILLTLFFFLVVGQFTFLASWPQLVWGLILIFILIGFSFWSVLIPALIWGFFWDVLSGSFFGQHLIFSVLLTVFFFWLAKEKLSIERNLASCLAFISLGFLFFALSQAAALFIGVGVVAVSWGQILLGATFWAHLLLNILIAVLLFFIFNFFEVKVRLKNA